MRGGLKKALAALACSIVMCLMVAGCGNNEAYKADFIGTWEITDMSVEGEQTSDVDLELMKEFGLTVYLELDEDGKASLELFGEASDGTWEATGQKQGKLTFNDSSATIAIDDDGLLVMSEEEDELKFKKIDPSEKEAASAEVATDGEDATTEGEAPAAEGEAAAEDDAA